MAAGEEGEGAATRRAAVRREKEHRRAWPHVAHALRLLATAWTVASAPPSGGRVPQTNGAEIQLDSFNPCDAGCVQGALHSSPTLIKRSVSLCTHIE